MAKDYKVSQAFQAKDRDSGEVEVINTKAGACHKYIFKVDGQPIDGWLNILRKIEDGESKPVEKGDMLYGDIVENNWGKAQFNRVQRPEGMPPVSNNGSSAQKDSPKADTAGMGSVSITVINDKLDKIINILEPKRSRDVTPTDAPADIDLTELDY